MTAISGTGAARPPMGFVAPQPQSLIADNIKARSKVEIRPGEPVYVFIERRMGNGTRLEGLNKKTPFVIKQVAKPPAGVPVPRTMGDWYQISLKPGEKAGQKDQVKLISSTVTLHPKETAKPFTLVSGSLRYY